VQRIPGRRPTLASRLAGARPAKPRAPRTHLILGSCRRSPPADGAVRRLPWATARPPPGAPSGRARACPPPPGSVVFLCSVPLRAHRAPESGAAAGRRWLGVRRGASRIAARLRAQLPACPRLHARALPAIWDLVTRRSNRDGRRRRHHRDHKRSRHAAAKLWRTKPMPCSAASRTPKLTVYSPAAARRTPSSPTNERSASDG